MNLLEVAHQAKAAKEELRLAEEKVKLEGVANRILMGLERYGRVERGVANPIIHPRHNYLEVDGIRFRLSGDGKALEVFAYHGDPEYVDPWEWRKVEDITDLIGMRFSPEEKGAA